MTLRAKLLILAQVSLVMIVALRADASADVVSIPQSAFPSSATLITFNGLAVGTEVNGLTVGGVSFAYSLGNGAVNIGIGPGDTNNMAVPNVVSNGNNTGTLTITLPTSADLFGYGYALQSSIPITNATTISVFSGVTPLGTLSYNGVPDPNFAGGFAGIQSTIPFNRVQVTFNSTEAPDFALDNIRFGSATTPVPEPATMLLLGTGLAGIGGAAWRKRHAKKK